MSVLPFDGMDCGAPVLHMRGLCIDIRAIQQEHSFPIFLALLLLTSFAIPMGAFVSGLQTLSIPSCWLSSDTSAPTGEKRVSSLTPKR